MFNPRQVEIFGQSPFIPCYMLSAGPAVPAAGPCAAAAAAGTAAAALSSPPAR